MTIILLVGYLAFNGTLEQVGYTRQTKPVAIIVDRDREIQSYECLLGVPHHLRHLVGQELYFFSFKHGKLGPWLVTDLEATHHAGYMKENQLIDNSCEKYTHDKGVLLWIQ